MKKPLKDTVRAFKWMRSKGQLLILDQLRIPTEEKWIACRTHVQVAECIQKMHVRGAPAIGCVAAYGLLLAAYEKKTSVLQEFTAFIYQASQVLASTRPTAINLFWALERMKVSMRNTMREGKYDRERIKNIKETLEKEADSILQEDLAGNRRMGELGAALLGQNATVMTHCNAGSLATSGWGTALGVIRTAFEQGKIKKVLVNETRPYLQGARLTAWELHKDGIPYDIITDSMAAHIMKTEKIDAVIVGADRIAANGDFANKIGTYGLAVLAHYHRVPLYSVAPMSSIDLTIQSGQQIPIEERSHHEVTHIHKFSLAPQGATARHPAFDVTPGALVSAIVTERGIARPPSKQTIAQLFEGLPQQRKPSVFTSPY